MNINIKIEIKIKSFVLSCLKVNGGFIHISPGMCNTAAIRWWLWCAADGRLVICQNGLKFGPILLLVWPLCNLVRFNTLLSNHLVWSQETKKEELHWSAPKTTALPTALDCWHSMIFLHFGDTVLATALPLFHINMCGNSILPILPLNGKNAFKSLSQKYMTWG